MSEIVDTISDDLEIEELLTMEVTGFTPMFGSPEGADRYFSEMLDGQLWEVTNADLRRKALITATRGINNLRFAGSKSLDSQPLEWPRNGEATIPENVQQATYEEALALLKGVDPETEAGNIFVTSRVFGKVGTDYDYTTAPEHVLAGIASRKAWLLLKPSLSPAKGIKLRRGS